MKQEKPKKLGRIEIEAKNIALDKELLHQIYHHQQRDEFFNLLNKAIDKEIKVGVKEELKKTIDFVYGFDSQGQPRFKDGEKYSVTIASWGTKIPRFLTRSQIANHLFNLDQLTFWNKLVNLANYISSFGQTSIVVKQENLIKLPSLRKLFSELNKLGLIPELRIIYTKALQSDIYMLPTVLGIKIRIQYEKGKIYSQEICSF